MILLGIGWFGVPVWTIMTLGVLLYSEHRLGLEFFSYSTSKQNVILATPTSKRSGRVYRK